MLALALADSLPSVRVDIALVIAGAALALLHADSEPAAGLALALVVVGSVLALAHAVPLPAVRIVRTAHCLGQRLVTLGLGCRCELRAQHGHAVDGRASERGRVLALVPVLVRAQALALALAWARARAQQARALPALRRVSSSQSWCATSTGQF